ncbi:MAG: HAD family hydrolase [Spirochaetales bacterium]|nr:HAD family hydrolase [Spirochaetales bacterium]
MKNNESSQKKSNPRKCIALFDFDHTITRKDSFLDFLLSTINLPRLILGSLIQLPVLLAFLFKIMSNEKAKEKVLSFYFKGMTKEQFAGIGDNYSKNRLPAIIMKDALERIEWHKKQNHQVVIISASLRCWLGGWCKEHKIDLICTEMEIQDGIVTGKLKGKNCYGPEKVRRIREHYDLDSYYIYAYGDSRGDKEMLDSADEKFYRHFKG